ncbi:MAG TPA: preprotein translocase subunit YajC [Terriglobia bacterium]|nr:preprotein translocase subunit YajC [Terriglobia bacterium]
MLGFINLQALLLASTGSGAEGIPSLILFLGLLVVIWYLLIIRPQSRQRRKLQDMISNLKTGDRVVTNGGILGTVTGFGSNTVQLQVANQVKIEVLRSAISSLQSDDAASPAKKSDETPDREASLSSKGRK